MMGVRKVASEGRASSIAGLATELSLAIKKHDLLKADKIFNEISCKSNEIETSYATKVMDFPSAVKTFNIKPSNSLDKYYSHFIHNDVEAIRKDWASVGDSLWLSFAKSLAK